MRKNRFLTLIMVIIVVLTSSLNVFAKDEWTKDESRQAGYDIGYIDGLIKGAENSSKDKDEHHSSARPSRDEMKKKYKDELKGKDENEFYIGYIEGFQSGYEENYKTGDKDSKPEETKTNYADSLGRLLGEIYGFRDYHKGVKSNSSKARPSNTNLRDMFNLKNQSSRYRSSFYSEFKESFKKAYEDGYEKANLESEKLTMESGIADGETVGTVLGNIYGAKDYFENKANNYSRNKPSDSSIIRDYSLNKDSREYKEGFLIGFKRSFEESYNLSFREANIKATMGSVESAYEDGKAAGLSKGQLQANHDYYEEKSNNWKRNKVFSSQIIAEYNLVYQEKEYKDGFISGFLDGFTEGYNTAYNNLSQQYVVEKSVVGKIPKSGGVLTTNDGELSVKIEKGTFYNDVSVSIETSSPFKYNKNNRYIKTSKLYNIKITNNSGNVNGDKKVKLSFNYFDDYRGGVYKKVDNKFIYKNSSFEEDKIIALVNPSTLTSKDNIYCVQIDKQVSIFPDARGNWANDEINTFVRRGIINGYSDGYFKPDLNVTRAEFLTLLSRVYNWNPKDNKGIERFTDYYKFGNRDKTISYAMDKGYINGYSDNTFRPNASISYKEIEIIMSRVLDSPDFKWYNTSAKMMYDKQKKSNSYNSINNFATRAEIVYMLYILNEWRY